MNSTTVTGPATGPVAENRPPASPRVGMLPPFDLLERGASTAAALLAKVGDAGLDHICCGDHVSFVAASASTVSCRPPRWRCCMPRCRSTAACTCCRCVTRSWSPVSWPTSHRIAPGRLIFGVGRRR